ncbi:hypothetical protein ACTHTV_19830, partial [Neisseria sp. P0015.S010]
FGLANLVARRKTAQQSRDFPIAGKNFSAINHTSLKTEYPWFNKGRLKELLSFQTAFDLL